MANFADKSIIIAIVKQLYGLIGNPISHSYSHSYFNNFFKKKGIDAEYRNFELEDIGQIVELIAEEPDLKGFNVTSPFKRQILPYIDNLSDEAKAAQAVNTVKIIRSADGNDFTLYGFNTDIGGFRRSIEPLIHRGEGLAIILGTGGASCAAEIALKSLGFDCVKVSRSVGKADVSYDELRPDELRRAKIIVNATPLGMHANADKCAPIEYSALSCDTLCIDMVYNPSLTLFMKKCADAGAAVKNGYSMLLNQAILAWEIWNND